MLGVPEELGGAFEERSAVTSALSPRRSPAATWASPSRRSLRPRSAPRSASGATPTSRPPTCPSSPARTSPPPRSRCIEPRAALRPLRARDEGPPRRRRLRPRRPQVARARAPPTPSSSSSPPTLEGGGPGPVHRRGRRPRASSTQPGAGDRASAPPAPAELKLERRQAPGGRAARRGRRRRLRRLHPPRADRLVRDDASAPRRRALDFLIPYVKERKAFGEPIANRQAVAFNMSNIAIEIEGMRLATYRAASLADQGQRLRPRDRDRPPALRAPRASQIGSDAVGLLGGHGYVKEYPVERWYRDLRAAGVIEGGAARMMHQPRGPEEVRAARRAGHTRSPRRSCGRSRASTTSPSTSTRRSSTCSRR